MDTSTQLYNSVRGLADDLTILVDLLQSNPENWQIHAAEDFLSEHGYEPVIGNDGSYDLDQMYEDLSEFLNEWPLEAKIIGEKEPGGEFEPTHVEVLFTTGGPHIELDTGKRAVIGWWGSESATWGVSSEVCGFFEDLYIY